MDEGKDTGRDTGKDDLVRDIISGIESKGSSYDKEDLLEAREMVEEAQKKLGEVIELLEQALRNTPESGHYKAYVVDHLTIMLNSSHGFLSRDTNLENWIDHLQEAINDEGGDDDEE